VDKKQEILKTRFDIYCEKGYHLSVTELASTVNIKTPSPYSHFESKDEIWSCLSADELKQAFDDLRYIGDTPPDICPVCKVPNWKFEKVEGRQ
jgi:AcrR family transcriptional regulator